VLNAWNLTARYDCDLRRQASALCCRSWARGTSGPPA